MSSANARPTLTEAARVWLRIGLLGFGGPAGQIALMHGELVERRRWIEEAQFLDALNYCFLIPGPEAQQLATYIGWSLHGFPGAFVAGGLFVLPGALVIVLLALLYTSFHHLLALTGLFLGLKAAVLAVVLEALLRMGRRTIETRRQVAVATLSFAAMAFTTVPFPVLVLAAALTGGLFLRRPPPAAEASEASEASPAATAASPHLGARHLARVLGGTLLAWGVPFLLLRAAFGTESVFVREATFFTKVAAVTFGGAYALLAYVAQEGVSQYGWLLPGEMLDGFGLAETTPGPLMLVVLFVGYLGAHRFAPPTLAWSPVLAGCLGALVTLWATFVPSFFWILLGAPWVASLRQRPALRGALAGVSAAVVGVIANLALWFALHVLFREQIEHRGRALRVVIPILSSVDETAAALAILATWLLFRTRWGMTRTLALCALLGLALVWLG